MSVQIIDANIIKKTQDSLGRIIKKPPMTEKLLSKPPFRFLHDIMTSVIKTTGFMNGLFSESEMNSDNVKEKESKVSFLQKVIDMISLVLGKTLSARPSRIISGSEPEKTNEMLQMLAEAINKKIDNDEYVQRVLKPDNVAVMKSKDSSKHKQDEKDANVNDDRKREGSPSKKEKKHRSKHEEGRHRDEDRLKKRDKSKHEEDDGKKEHRKKEKSGEDKERTRDKHRSNERHRSRKRGGDDDDEDKHDKKRHSRKDEGERMSKTIETKKNEIKIPPRPSSAKGPRRQIVKGRQVMSPTDKKDAPPSYFKLK